MEALAYLRVPSAKRGPSFAYKSAQAPDRSPLIDLEEAAAAAGYELERVFQDTASNRRSPAYQALLEYLDDQPRFRVLLIPSWEHVAQEPLSAAERILELEALNVSVASIAEDDALEAALTAWNIRHEQRAARVRRGMERRAVQGMGLGRPPYGYRIGERGHFEILEDEARTVRLIYRLYLRSGLGLRLIAAQLNDEGRRTRRGSPWSIVSIRTILRNRAYLGTYDRFGFRVPSAHPPIISGEEYRLAQERLARFNLAGIVPQPSVFLLSDLVHCGSCGNTMMGVSRSQRWRLRSGEEREGVYRYYQCQSRRNLSLCQYSTQRAPTLEAMVIDELRRIEPQLPPLSSLDLREATSKAARTRTLQDAALGHISLSELRDRSRAWFREISTPSSARSWQEELSEWNDLPMSRQRALLVAVLEDIVVKERGVDLVLRKQSVDTAD
jgi:DNA invertase Pin-like site-specific DNA recombinase